MYYQSTALVHLLIPGPCIPNYMGTFSIAWYSIFLLGKFHWDSIAESLEILYFKYLKNTLNCSYLNKIGLDQNFIDNEKEKSKFWFTLHQSTRYTIILVYVNSIWKTQSWEIQVQAEYQTWFATRLEKRCLVLRKIEHK